MNGRTAARELLALAREVLGSAEYVVFHDNAGKHRQVAVVFASEFQAESFIQQYGNLGGFRRFEADMYGYDKGVFVELAEVKESDIVRKSGRDLFDYLMAKFE